ncbi:MAG: adenosylcobinamide-GDP ribazoletransferase [Acidimicrobiales bacterium mtb01]|nr:adenosylcobinamide-GDP ribazoletransferase [Actinomycetota bacterium]TEX47856.1 MAG: adenosylcobinamide-GDP ribazoletransferase [Acidimicrobiales bacterium mtb01]
MVLAMTGLIGALVFLTRLPIRTRRSLDTATSVPWFPVAGLLVGALVGGVAAVLEPWASPSVAAAVAVTLGLLVTGCFHEDGLADVADAFVGGWTRDDRLRILKDPRHGTYGVAALVASVLVRVLALGTLVSYGPKIAFAGAVVAHGLARSGAVATMIVAEPASGEGLGADYVARLDRTRAVFGIVVATGASAALVGWWAAVAVGMVALSAWMVSAWSGRCIGGFSGDVLGAIEQVGEITVLVALSIVAGHHQLWW